MSKDDVPAPEALRGMLRYDADTGELFWRARAGESATIKRWNGRFADKPAGTLGARGYINLRVNYRLYRAHRVAWAMFHNAWPKGEIDHINGDRTDNRVGNLREVSKADNARNHKRRTDNTCGVTGVRPHSSGKWQARIKVDGRPIHLGTFDTIEDAAKARKLAERSHGFHPNHGREQLETAHEE